VSTWYTLYCEGIPVANYAKRSWAIDFINQFPYNGSAYTMSSFSIVEKQI